MASGLRELKLWQESAALAGEVCRAARGGARRETKVLTDRLMLAGCTVAESIADAHGRYDAHDQQRAYRAARRALLVLETDLTIARHAELLSASALAQLSTRAVAVSRLLSGYLAFLERQIDAGAAPARTTADVPTIPALAGAAAQTADRDESGLGAPVFVEP